MDLRSFVEAYLPRPPARVLEVGCGRGDLARALASSGYEVVAANAALHGYAALRTQLDRRFDVRFFAWTPYLHGSCAVWSARQRNAT